MARPRRFALPGIPQHVVQRGIDRQPVFFEDADRVAYLEWLRQAASHYQLEVHAYVLMTNHVHLLVTPHQEWSVSRTMQQMGRYYVPHVNKKYARTGSLWEGRHKASVVDSERYLLGTYRYIELNPLRALMVDQPVKFPWSSYRANAMGYPNRLVTPHPCYLALGASGIDRRATYQDFVGEVIDTGETEGIREALRHNHILGDERFRSEIEKMIGRRVGTGRPGRPRRG